MMKFKITMLILLSANLLMAQDQDNIEIETVITNYIQSFFLNDYTKMDKSLHERLSKRGMDNKGVLSEDYSKNDLKVLMGNKKPLPLSQQSNRVSGIFIDRNFATAILDTGYPSTRWKEYIHLAKIDGVWIIMDVFWNFE